MIFAVLWLVTACVFSAGREDDRVDSRPPVNQPPAGDTAPSDSSEPSKSKPDSTKKEDNGDFIVEHSTIRNARFNEIDSQIKDERLLENAAEDLNNALILPNDIYLRSKDCGEVNAYFDPNDQSITICYELMEHFFKLYRLAGLSEDRAYDKMFDAIRFVFLHEVGHALIYNYKLPVVGNEEDAADRCSSYINIEELGEEGVRSVLAAADAFYIESRQNTPTGRDMADEHLLQEQRFYNSLCMIYGSNPNKYQYFVTERYLPKERAVRCPTEFQRTVDGWINLLQPWRKDR